MAGRDFKRRTAPNVDVRLVLAVCVTLVSAVQYYTAWTRYDEAVKYLTTVPKYRLRAVEIAKEDGTWPDHSNRKGRVKDKAKEREEQEAVVRKVGRAGELTNHPLAHDRLVFFRLETLRIIIIITLLPHSYHQSSLV